LPENGTVTRAVLILLAALFALAALAGCEEGSTAPEQPVRDEEPSLVPPETPTKTSLEETPRTERRNVVVIVLESTRARSVTPYNPGLETTPFLDELSKESLLAGRAYAIVPHTSKALVAGECGIWPNLVREITESEPGNIPARCLADLLGEQGYRTVWFQNGHDNFENRPQLVENFGHEEFYSLEDMDREGYERVNYFGYEEDIMLEPSREWLRKNGDEPFYAMYKTVGPHHQYLAPDRYGRKDFVRDDELNRYLNAIRNVDFFVKNLIGQYRDLGLYEDTIFVIYGDHGEGFGEHQRRQHDNTIYEEGLAIPMLVHDPRRWPEGERVEEPASQMDVLPTVLDLLGYEVAGGEYPGRSLLDLPEDRTLMFNCWYDNRCMASLDGYEKYIYHFGEREEELFDLKEDPLEKNNLAGPREGEREDRRAALFEWRARVIALHETG
jgi:lipoteichoic acid synthase